MPQYTYQDPKSGATVTLEGDTPPTEQELDEVFRSVAPTRPMDAAYMRAAAMAGGGSMGVGYPISGPQALRGAVTGGRVALEAGGTALAQAAGAASPIPGGSSLAGMAASRFLNTLGQLAEYAIYDKPYDPVETEKATLMGGVTLAGPEQIATARMGAAGLRAAEPSMAQAAGRALQTGGRFGTAAAATEAAVETAATGELPGPAQLGMAAAAPFALGSAGQFLQDKGSTIVDRAARAANAIDFFRKANIEPTPGMMDPKRFALMEQRLINQEPLGPLAEKQERAYEALASGVYDVAPGQMPERTVFDMMKEKMTGIQAARDKVRVLGADAEAAQKRADQALLNLNAERSDYTKKVAQASDDALNQAVDGALNNARLIAQSKMTQGPQAMNPAAGRTAMVQQVIDPLDKAYDVHWARMYAPFPNKAPLFDTGPILQEAERIYGNYKVKLPEVLKSVLAASDEEAPLVLFDSKGRPISAEVTSKGGKASLDALRNLRDMILKKGRIDASDPGIMEGELRKFAGFISGQLDEQAPKAFGKDVAEQFHNVQADYKNYAELWKKPGVEMLFVDNPTDDVVTKIVQGIEKSGAEADEFKNLRNLIANMAEPQKAKEVVQEGGQFMFGTKGAQVNPELAGRLAQHVNDLLRSNILYQSSKNGRVDPSVLLRKLEKVGNDPEALRLLGFGTQDQIRELTTLFSDYPLASKMAPEEWNQLYASQAFREALEKGGQLTSLLKPNVQLSELKNEMMLAARLKNAGQTQQAEKLYQSSLEKARDLRVSEQQVRAKLNSMEVDPTFAMHINGPVDPKNYNNLIDLTTSVGANATTTAYLKTLADVLRNSKLKSDQDLLLNWQRGFIRDQIMSEGGAGVSTEKLSDVFGGVNRRAAQKQMELAKAILEPEQIEALKKLGEAATGLRYYERAGSATGKRTTDILANRGTFLRGYDALADMWRRRNYDQVATALLDPEEYIKKQAIAGEWLQLGGKTLKGVAPTVNRFLPQQQQQQVPSSVPQFLRR